LCWRPGRSAWLFPGFALLVVLLGCGGEATEPALSFRLGITTTIEDSGLLTDLQQAFAQAHPGIRMVTLTGGTGEVLELGRRKDVDVTITHDPAAESVFVAQGHGRSRHELMYNDFVVAGPPSDPAGVRGQRDVAEALRAVARSEAPFVSRGDDSGTHRKELFLWQQAGLTIPTTKARWYIEAGVGMGEALRVASARTAYLLTDRATFLTLQQQLDLVVLSEGDARLRNRYGLVRMTGTPNGAAADSFAAWVTSAQGHAVISTFGVARFGRQLFTPVQ
jgi:tungstate transport system substrate-binding protein